MPRQKKPTYTYLKDKKLYQKKVKDADGKYFCLYAPTTDELTEKIRSAEQQVAAAKGARGNPTVEQYASQWQELNLASVSGKTKDVYAYIIRNYITATIGRKALQSVTPDDCLTVLLGMSKMSSSAYGKAVILMKRIFDAAVDSGYIAANPARKLKSGGVAAKEKVALTQEQQRALLAAVTGTVAEAFVMIGLHTGMRREEILGLQWDCVVLDGTPHISVRRAVRWEHNQPIVSEELKSKAAYRDIPIPPELVTFLKAEKAKRDADCVENKFAFVISNTSGGAKSQVQFKNMWRVIDARSVGTYYGMKDGEKKELEKKLGEKCPRHNFCYTIDFHVTPHLLRHTYITD